MKSLPSAQPYQDKTDLAIKHVKALTNEHLIVGIPQGVFMLGIAVVAGSYFVTKLLWFPVVMAALYYLPMHQMHRDDPRGLRVWMAVLSSSTLVWEAGRRRPFHVTFL